MPASIALAIEVNWSRMRPLGEAPIQSSRCMVLGTWCEAIERQPVMPVATILWPPEYPP